MKCYYCGAEMVHKSDAGYDEVYGGGIGIVSFFDCPACGADCMFSKLDDLADEEETP